MELNLSITVGQKKYGLNTYASGFDEAVVKSTRFIRELQEQQLNEQCREDDDSRYYRVIIASVPTVTGVKIRLIKAVREVTGLGLKEAKELVESHGPKLITHQLNLAQRLAMELRAVGAEAYVSTAEYR